MKMEIINDQSLDSRTSTIIEYITLPQYNFSSSECNNTIQSKNRKNSLSVMSTEKNLINSTKLNTGSIKKMKQTNITFIQTTEKYGNRYVKKIFLFF